MLNINKYEIKAKYLPTGRQRKVIIEARSEEEALSKLGSEYSDVKSVTVKNRPPTERQIDYAHSLGINITDDMCFEDVRCLISRKTDDRQPPKQGLIDFADAHNISFSNFTGKKALYNSVFYGLPQKDAIAFFIFSLYRYLSDDRESNLDKSLYKIYFYEFAEEYNSNSKFVKSLYDNYRGEDLRFFGTLHISDSNGESWNSGGSAKTYALKCAKNYLYERNLIEEHATTTKTINNRRPQKPRKEESTEREPIVVTEAPEVVKKTGLGCLLPIVAAFATVCILACIL